MDIASLEQALGTPISLITVKLTGLVGRQAAGSTSTNRTLVTNHYSLRIMRSMGIDRLSGVHKPRATEFLTQVILQTSPLCHVNARLSAA